MGARLVKFVTDIALLEKPSHFTYDSNRVDRRKSYSIILKPLITTKNDSNLVPESPNGGKTALDIHDILKILPHRYPLLLIDRVLELKRKERIVAIKNVTINEPFFNGHF